jgi:hypothetical protein
MVSEPVFITTQGFGSHRRGNDQTDRGGQYIAFYFVGQIPADAVRFHPPIKKLSFLPLRG